MKTKVNFDRYGDFPDFNTVKDIVIYGVNKGKDQKQCMFKNFAGEVETKTFNQTFYDAVGIGSYFYAQGLRNKKIAILSENSYYWISIFYALSMGRFVAIPLDAKLTAGELTDIMLRSECDAICYTQEFEPAIGAMKNTQGIAVKCFFKIEEFDKMVAQGHLCAERSEIKLLEDNVNPGDLAYIVYTSGTTGKSKGVMLSQENVSTDTVATLRAMTAGQTVAFLPFNHTFSWASALIASLLLAEWGYICDSLKNLQGDIVTYKPQHFTAVPLAVENIYQKIWRTAKKEGRDAVLKKGIKISNFLLKLGIDVRRKLFSEVIENLGGNLEMIICGGAYLDEKYERGLYEMGIQVINGYGITECSPVVTCNRLDNFKFGSAGKVIGCNEIKVSNPDDEGVGEIYVRGTNVMMGYYNDSAATRQAFDGDWFKTGDYGYIDKDGFLFFRGRKKNLIILSNGKNVSPEEIEDKLSGIDYVNEVLVYEENGYITAEFFLNTEAEPNANEKIKADLECINRSVAKYKRVQKLKIRETEFPKTTTLKIKRPYKSTTRQ